MQIKRGLLCLMLLFVGCAHPKPPTNFPPPSMQPPIQRTYVTPDLRTLGRVELVNAAAGFLVVSFPPGHVPPRGQHWEITHLGVKVGEVTISGPQREADTVADIVDGTANIGDQARAKSPPN
jgi:hypothetical protein